MTTGAAAASSIERQRSLLLLVDLQERLVPAIHDFESLFQRVAALIEGAKRLEVPIAFTEQAPEGLGPTLPLARGLAPDAIVLEKLHFCAVAEPANLAALRAYGRPQVVLAGTESHVCVLQTALGLLREGFELFLVTDAVGSRQPEDRARAIERLTGAGAIPVTTEMVLFEWLAASDHEAFRPLLAQIKALGPASQDRPTG